MGVDYQVIAGESRKVSSPVGSPATFSGSIQLITSKKPSGYSLGEQPEVYLRGSIELNKSWYEGIGIWYTWYRIVADTGEIAETGLDWHSCNPFGSYDLVVDERDSVKVPRRMPNRHLGITVSLYAIHYYAVFKPVLIDTKDYIIPLEGLPPPEEATVIGVVRDTEGKPVPSVKASIDGIESITSDSEGGFYFTGIDPGFYTITCEKAGYGTATAEVNLVLGNNSVTVFMVKEEDEERAVPSWAFVAGGTGIGLIGGYFSRNRAIGMPLGGALGAGLGYVGHKIYSFEFW